MHLDELKASWKSLDEKVAATQELSEQIALSMMKEHSKSTVSKIQAKLKKLALYFIGLLTLFIAILAGNPFDYTNWYEYVPAAAYALLVIAGLEIIIREMIAIRKVRLTKSNLRESLQKIIQFHEAYQSVMDTVWKISMVIGFLLGISLLVRNFETYGWTKSVVVVAVNGIFVSAMYLIAKKVFKQLPDTNLAELKINLAELEQ
ncbi:hypothetical protein [Dyadobacter sp. LHD-138]|uniref:hypothetical protein n=1 Tax=Dyadobacter sp. LHD-138 TaxID=3071413 RepID=UPI0027DF0377|nr:hypothetical protein [Dyadobacter sp. LHD-138]MDQ6476845.1 hypothetical protein [Dyadobacter sp. LHD-138]